MYLKERVYWDTLARVLRLDGREGEEGGQQNGNLTRERARASVVGSIHRRKWVTFSSIYEKSFYHGEKELFTFSIDMES